MKNGFVKSSPHFFRMIVRSMALLTLFLLALAAFVPAPLQTPADPALTPNPVKSAWFLLWIQELLSWSRGMIWVVIALATLLFLLPWLAGFLGVHLHRARWFPPEQRCINLLVLFSLVAILVLTLVAMFLRGANWSLVF